MLNLTSPLFDGRLSFPTALHRLGNSYRLAQHLIYLSNTYFVPGMSLSKTYALYNLIFGISQSPQILS